MPNILIIDDEQAFADGLTDFLNLKGHNADSAGSVAEARLHLDKTCPDVVLLDLMLPDGSGLELMDVFEHKPPKKLIIMTGHTGVKSLIGAMAGDGVGYMKKPIEPRDLEGILNALDDSEDAAPKSTAGQAHFGLMVGDSKSMQDVYEQIRQVAPTNSTVFIQGESGTGKELVAESIHKQSGREGPFIPINSGGLMKDLISSQLFGHEKGSFTGADAMHKGFFEQANEGTLFLDEITEMPMDMQIHLLRVLETHKVSRLGSHREIPINTRLLAATNRDPAEAVKEGLLREDLYFRLCVFPIELPPLRTRRGDVSLLAQKFLRELNQQNKTEKCLTTKALQELERHHWPGNVRELKNLVHRSYIMSRSDAIEMPTRFDEVAIGEIEGISVGRSIADVERDLILATLEHLDGDKNAAAATLGVSLKTLYNRLKSYEDK